MPVAEHRPGYDEVFTVTEYYDGPCQGIANFRGRAHFYDFDEAKDDDSNLYRLTPVGLRILDLAMEDWAILEMWESAFHTGRTTLESHLYSRYHSQPQTDPFCSVKSQEAA
jgi:hypothetical protein